MYFILFLKDIRYVKIEAIILNYKRNNTYIMSNNANVVDNANEHPGDILGNYVDMDEEDTVNADYRTVDNYFDFKVFYYKQYGDSNNTKHLVVAYMRHTPLLYKGQITPVNNGSLFQIVENICNIIKKGEYQLSFIRNTDGAELLFEFTYGSMFGVPLVYKLKLVNEAYDSLSWFEGHTFDKIKKEHDELKDKYNKLEEENEKLKSKYEELDGKYNKLKEENKALNDDYEELDAGHEELKDRCKELESAISDAQDAFGQLV